MAISRPVRRSNRSKSEQPDPVDVQVGSRVRLRRNMLGLSQEKLGEAIGLTFQQVQKYERGANRIGASRPARRPGSACPIFAGLNAGPVAISP